MALEDPQTGRVYPDDIVESLSDAQLASRVAADRAHDAVLSDLAEVT